MRDPVGGDRPRFAIAFLRGRRCQEIILVSTLLDAHRFSAAQLAVLYFRRRRVATSVAGRARYQYLRLCHFDFLSVMDRKRRF